MQTYLPWIIFIVLLALIFGFCYVLVNYYMDSTEKNALSMITVALSYTLGLVCLLLIPVDVFLVSEQHKKLEDIFLTKQDLMSFSTYLNIFTLAFAFCWIPFVYFYGEEKEEKGDFDFDVQSPATRIWISFKKTLSFVALVVVLLLLGLIFRSGINKLTILRYRTK